MSWKIYLYCYIVKCIYYVDVVAGIRVVAIFEIFEHLKEAGRHHDGSIINHNGKRGF